MGNHKLFYHDPKLVRDSLNGTIDLADQIHLLEQSLIARLYRIDQERFYIRYGYRSLTSFCLKDLKFSKTQTQRIVTQVRRHIPTSNIAEE